MHGKWVTVNLGEDVECKVWINCMPDTPEDVLQRLAINILQNKLPKKKTGLTASMEAISIISDWEYAQGRGARFEAEQAMKRMLYGAEA